MIAGAESRRVGTEFVSKRYQGIFSTRCNTTLGYQCTVLDLDHGRERWLLAIWKESSWVQRAGLVRSRKVGPGGRQCEQHFSVKGGEKWNTYPVVRRYEYRHSFSQAAIYGTWVEGKVNPPGYSLRLFQK